MHQINRQELKDILDKHGKWLRHEEGGERANLSCADLSYTRLENKALLTFCFGKHTASFLSEDSITIGCHTYPTAYWVEHFATIGTQAGYTTAQIQEYGRFIKGCAKIQASMPKEPK